MFDPTIFDNLKVSLENQLYDLDNLENRIRITGRKDLLDLAVMSREFSLFFQLADVSLNSGRVTAEVHLKASLRDLAEEILETPGASPGCLLAVRFHTQISDVPKQCGEIGRVLSGIWGSELAPRQTLSYVYGQEKVYQVTAEVKFNRKINEDQMNDLPDLIDHILRSLEELEAYLRM
jgi:hypothetical protein